MAEEITLKGKVILKKVSEGSKSEHEAICLETGDCSFILRRIGGNAFHDPVLHKLKGKKVTARGVISNYTFFAKEISEEK